MTRPGQVPPSLRARTWPIAILAVLAVALATASLVVALTRSRPGSTPVYTPAQRAAAKTKFCEQDKLADDAASVETRGTDMALARIASISAAAILEVAAADPALNADYPRAALALAASYRTMTADATWRAENSQFKSSVNDLVAKNQALRDLCGD
jgi:hypothetical protein